LTFNPSGVIVIDSASSLGVFAPSATTAAFFNIGASNNPTLQVLPGITSVIPLAATQGLTQITAGVFSFSVNGAPVIADSTGATTSGVIGSSTLSFPGV